MKEVTVKLNIVDAIKLMDEEKVEELKDVDENIYEYVKWIRDGSFERIIDEMNKVPN